MAVAQHMVVRRARVKPYVQNVVDLGVLLGINRAQNVGGADLAPGFHAAGIDHVGCLIHDFHGARVQLAGGSVQEKRQWHAPVALPADAPVGPPGNHALQAQLAVFGVEAGFVDGRQGQLAQRLFSLVAGENALCAGRFCVHADKPLGGSAVDDRRLVAPAMRVAVNDVVRGEQPAMLAQLVNHQRRGFPDVQAAKERQFIDIAAIALHRVQDVVVGNAVGDAGVKVFHAVSRRRMHDAGAVVSGGVVGQEDRAEAPVTKVSCVIGHIVKRVHEIQQCQLLALRRGQHGTGERKAFKAFFDQHRCQQQQAALGINQRIVQFRVQVQRLIGRNRPGGGGPDHGEGVFG